MILHFYWLYSIQSDYSILVIFPTLYITSLCLIHFIPSNFYFLNLILCDSNNICPVILYVLQWQRRILCMASALCITSFHRHYLVRCEEPHTSHSLTEKYSALNNIYRRFRGIKVFEALTQAPPIEIFVLFSLVPSVIFA